MPHDSDSAPHRPSSKTVVIALLAGFAFLAGGLLRSVLPFWVWIVLLVVTLFIYVKGASREE